MQACSCFHKDPPAPDLKPDFWLCGKHDRTGQYDGNGNADRRDEPERYFTNGRVYFITFLRLIAVPAVALLLLKVSGLVNGSPDGKKLLLIVFLAVITPSASTITQMCQVYGNDSQYASAINVMTTLFSIVTMPLMVLLFQMIL